MSISFDLIQRFKPIVYVPKEGRARKLVDILYETSDLYAVLWFHWPYDDYTGKRDYEPVVLVFRNDRLHKIGIRPHERYLSYNRWQAEESRPIVVFHTAWHAPMVKGTLRGTLVSFYSKIERSTRLDKYNIKKGRPPTWYNKNGTDKEVYSFADEIST
jgi:hypothetical protein